MKTKTKLAIQSNVLERLRKIRNGNVYDGITTFVKELVQNASRAKATKIWVTMEGNKFSIRDNGCGCDDPKKLFTLDYSGFGVGFGEGFNSIYSVADTFKVETAGWSGSLDIEKVLGNSKSTANDLMVDIEENHYVDEGFNLELEGVKLGEYYDSILEEVKQLCKYLPEIQTLINGEEIQKENLFDMVEFGPYTMNVENRLYTGRLSLSNDYYDQKVKVYYEYRFVQTLRINGAKGVILLKPNAVELRAPDRTAIINDEQYKRDKNGSMVYNEKTKEYEKVGKLPRLKNQLSKEVKVLLKELVAKGGLTEINDYAKIIESYLDVKEYIGCLDVTDISLFMEETKEKDLKEEDIPTVVKRPRYDDIVEEIELMEKLGLNKIDDEEENHQVVESDEQSNGQLRFDILSSSENSYMVSKIQPEQKNTLEPIVSQIAKPQEVEEEYVEEQEEMVQTVETQLPSSSSQSTSVEQDVQESNSEVDLVREHRDVAFSSPVTAGEKVKKEDMNGINIKNIKKKKNVVWCSKEDKEKYSEYISQFEYYGVYTFLSPHVLYDNALRHLNIPHVTEIENSVIRDYEVTNTGAKNKKELRAMELLSRIESLFNLQETFYISNIQRKLRVEVNGKKVYQEKMGIGGYEQFGYIHLNRKGMFFGKISGSHVGKDALGIHDVKFLIANLDLISHELAHALYNTEDNTKNHLEKEEIIRGEIIKYIVANS